MKKFKRLLKKLFIKGKTQQAWEEVFTINAGEKSVIHKANIYHKGITTNGDSAPMVIIPSRTSKGRALRDAFTLKHDAYIEKLPQKAREYFSTRPTADCILGVFTRCWSAKKGSEWYERDLIPEVKKEMEDAPVSSDIINKIKSELFGISCSNISESCNQAYEIAKPEIDKALESDNWIDVVKAAIYLSELLDMLPHGEKPKMMQIEKLVLREKEEGKFRNDLDLHADHKYEFLELKQEPVILDERLKIIANEFQSPKVQTSLKNEGQVTRRAWKINLGETKVFTHSEKVEEQVFIMIDLSGSMGCACERCEKKWTDVFKKANYPSMREAFQVATALATAFHGRVTVFGFCSNDEKSYIVPITSGHAPVCRVTQQHIPGGNPDCIALQFLQSQMSSAEHTTAIIISDAYPAGPSPFGDRHLVEHTKKLANELFMQGVKFGAVNVNSSGNEIYPSECSISIRQWREDIGKIKELFELIKSKIEV